MLSTLWVPQWRRGCRCHVLPQSLSKHTFYHQDLPVTPLEAGITHYLQESDWEQWLFKASFRLVSWAFLISELSDSTQRCRIGISSIKQNYVLLPIIYNGWRQKCNRWEMLSNKYHHPKASISVFKWQVFHFKQVTAAKPVKPVINFSLLFSVFPCNSCFYFSPLTASGTDMPYTLPQSPIRFWSYKQLCTCLTFSLL